MWYGRILEIHFFTGVRAFVPPKRMLHGLFGVYGGRDVPSPCLARVSEVLFPLMWAISSKYLGYRGSQCHGTHRTCTDMPVVLCAHRIRKSTLHASWYDKASVASFNGAWLPSITVVFLLHQALRDIRPN